MLLYRIFENRVQVHPDDIELLIKPHMSEYFRLENTPEQDRDKKKAEFIQYILGGDTQISAKYRVLMLKTHWQSDPWSDFDERFISRKNGKRTIPKRDMAI